MRNLKSVAGPLTYLILGQMLFISAGHSQDLSYSSNKLYNQGKKQTHQQDKPAAEKQTLFNVLKELNKTKGVYFLFSEKDMASVQVNAVKNQQAPVEKILDDVLDNTGLQYKKVSDNTF